MTESARQPSAVPVRRRPLGQGDCERWRARGIGQPTNTATSAGLVVGGLWVLHRSRAVSPAQRWRPIGYGVLLASAGLGSVAYHGLGGNASEHAHDRSIDVLVLATVLGEVERTIRRRSHRDTGTATVPAHAPADDVTSPVGPGRHPRGRAAGAVALTAALAAPVAYLLGRTSAPTCRPASRWQWHGLWHVLTAVAGTAWAERTLVRPYLSPAEPPGLRSSRLEGAP